MSKILVMKKCKMSSVVFKNNIRQNFWFQSCLLTICLVFLKFPLPTEKPHFLTVLIVWRQSSKRLAIKDSQVKHLHLKFPIVAIGHFVFFAVFRVFKCVFLCWKILLLLDECVIARKFPLGPRSHKRCQWCSLESHCFYLVHSRCCFDWIRFHKSQWSLYDPHTTIVLHQQQRSVQQTLFWPKY